jgi:CheY-like chemotaxis protein
MAGKPSSILVVDDEEGFRYAATKALQNAGYVVSSASDSARRLICSTAMRRSTC